MGMCKIKKPGTIITPNIDTDSIETVINEKYNPNQPPISTAQSETILEQIKSGNIFKILLDKDASGTGFFSLLPFPNKSQLLPVLMTNNHVLEERHIKVGEKIKLLINDKEQYIIIDEKRRTYTNEKYDITIIEIKAEDNLIIKPELFLEIDDFKDEDNFKKETIIYIIHFPLSGKISHSVGSILNINDITIKHFCSTNSGSSGGPIFNINNYKVIGLHKGYIKTGNYNIGLLLKEPIEVFYNKFKDLNFYSKNFIDIEKLVSINKFKKIDDCSGEFNMTYINRSLKSKITKDKMKELENAVSGKISINKIFGEKFVKNNKDKCHIIINGQKLELVSYYKIDNLMENVDSINIKLIGVNNLTDLSYMFAGCISLYSFRCSSKFPLKNITKIDHMFTF